MKMNIIRKIILSASVCAAFLTACGVKETAETSTEKASVTKSISDQTEAPTEITTAENTAAETTAAEESTEEQTAPTESHIKEFDVEVPENAAYKKTALISRKDYDFNAYQVIEFFDEHDNLILSLNQVKPGQTTPSIFQQTYEYNSDGTIASEECETMHGLQHIDHEYSNGILVKETTFINGNYKNTVSYTYDEYGNPITSVYENPDETICLETTYTYQYDGNGRFISIITQNNDGYKRNEQFTYDENGNIKTHIDNDKEIKYTYNSENRLIKEQSFCDGEELEYTEYEYEFYN